jgi:hypothetical protein
VLLPLDIVVGSVRETDLDHAVVEDEVQGAAGGQPGSVAQGLGYDHATGTINGG